MNEIDDCFNFKEMIKTEEGIEMLSCIINIPIDKLIDIINKNSQDNIK